MVGTPVTGTAFMLGRGMEHWHPDPAFYYQAGAGPLFDMGPYYLTMLINLLGPVSRVSAMTAVGQAERLITAKESLMNKTFALNTPTTVQSLLEFQCGAIRQFGTSRDVFKHSDKPIEIHGTNGSLQLPDPDTFGGHVAKSVDEENWHSQETVSHPLGIANWAYASPDRVNYRMLCVAEMVGALQKGNAPRASGELSLHVLDIMTTIIEASEAQLTIAVRSTTSRPEPLSFKYVGCLSRVCAL